MTIPRLFQPTPLCIGQELTVDDRALHYLTHVLRVSHSDRLHIFNGEGGEYVAEITHISRKKLTTKLVAFIGTDKESSLEIHLLQGLAKGEKMDFIIQKAVELGVKSITPIITSRSNVRLTEDRSEKRLAHWQAVIISACEQCGRNRIPEIRKPALFNDLIPELNGGFILAPGATSSQFTLSSPSNLLVGPEGGFTEQELSLAKQKNFISVAFGPRILRTETASIAAIAVLQALHGDLLTNQNIDR